MLMSTRLKMIEYANSLMTGADRAQCYNIARLPTGKSIAQALIEDHKSFDGAKRAARLIRLAGAATYTQNPKNKGWGVYRFEDGSQL